MDGSTYTDKIMFIDNIHKGSMFTYSHIYGTFVNNLIEGKKQVLMTNLTMNS